MSKPVRRLMRAIRADPSAPELDLPAGDGPGFPAGFPWPSGKAMIEYLDKAERGTRTSRGGG